MNDSTTKQCKKCGSEYPATPEFFYKNKTYKDGLSGDCKTCKAAYQREYIAANPIKVAKSRKEWARNNPHKTYESKRKWTANNPARVIAYYQQYYQDHKEAYRERGRQWYIDNPERAKEFDKRWRDKHPEKVAAKFNRRRNAPGSHTDVDIELQYKSQKGLCWWCGEEFAKGVLKPSVDHRIPLEKGGSHNPGNIVIAHLKCNCSKGAKMPWEYNGRLL